MQLQFTSPTRFARPPALHKAVRATSPVSARTQFIATRSQPTLIHPRRLTIQTSIFNPGVKKYNSIVKSPIAYWTDEETGHRQAFSREEMRAMLDEDNDTESEASSHCRHFSPKELQVIRKELDDENVVSPRATENHEIMRARLRRRVAERASSLKKQLPPMQRHITPTPIAQVPQPPATALVRVAQAKPHSTSSLFAKIWQFLTSLVTPPTAVTTPQPSPVRQQDDGLFTQLHQRLSTALRAQYPQLRNAPDSALIAYLDQKKIAQTFWTNLTPHQREGVLVQVRDGNFRMVIKTLLEVLETDADFKKRMTTKGFFDPSPIEMAQTEYLSDKVKNRGLFGSDED